jgi:hypothetical protein
LRLEVESVLSTQFVASAVAFAPAVAFLASDKSMIGAPTVITLAQAARFVDGGFFAGTATVPEGAAYLVIISSRALAPHSPAVGMPMESDNRQWHLVQPSQHGLLRVKLVAASS